MTNDIRGGLQPHTDSFLAVLQRLDALLARATAAATTAYGPEAAADPFRGLHISRDDAARLLAQEPGEPVFGALLARDRAMGHAEVVPSGAVPGADAVLSNGNGSATTAAFARNGRLSFFGNLGRGQCTPNGGAVAVPPSPPELKGGQADEVALDPLSDDSAPDLAGEHPQLLRLARAFGLTRFDLDLIVIALAPELDLRYERLYAYLQDDVTRRRPSLDLALNLLCSTAEAKWARRSRAAADAPLARHNLVTLVPDPSHLQPPLLTQYLKLDHRIVDYLLGRDSVDDRLARTLRWIEPEAAWPELGLSDEVAARLASLLRWYHTQSVDGQATGLTVFLYGPDGAGKRAAAEAVCNALGTGLLVVDMASLLQTDLEPETLVRLVFREAILLQTPLYWGGFEKLLADEERARAVRAALVEQLDELTGLTILAGTSRWASTGALHDKAFVSIEVPVPDYAGRRTLWERALDGATAEAPDLHSLANQFRFGPGQIRDAVATARNRALWRDPAEGHVTMDDLLAACRVHSRHKLGALARQIPPVYGWDDIVLSADQVVQLREVCQSVRYRPTVYADWGFERKLARGKGLNVIFAGPSGTGKTMAAEIIAGDLGLDLFKIDLSTVVSKYIGETEKNLERIFGEAQTSNAILFFDEADALFGKRSEVKDAHDRYANIEISYLLQRMEEYDGIVIMATNLKSNLDEAFVRRMQFIVDFPFPEETDRLGIWHKIWPAETPRADDLDLGFMARQFRITGGNIKNIALAGAFLAAADGGTVAMRHLVQATRREYQKMGKLCTEAEFGPYIEWVRG